MTVEVDHRRVLLAARPTEAVEWRTLFANPAMHRWECVEAETFVFFFAGHGQLIADTGGHNLHFHGNRLGPSGMRPQDGRQVDLHRHGFSSGSTLMAAKVDRFSWDSTGVAT